MTDVYKASIAMHKKFKGKLEVRSLVPVKNRKDLSLAYTPGVAGPSNAIAADPELSFSLTCRGRTIAVISDGSAVLGLGNIGPEAGIPVMEGKAILFKEFGGVDAVPIVVNTQDPGEIITFVKQIAPSFAGINLEDIAAPRCFQILESLQTIGIPVFHDDQDGTAIVISAALRNAAIAVSKPYESLKVVIVGAGAAGLATARMLLGLSCTSSVCERIPHGKSVGDVIVIDREGALVAGREKQNIYKQAIAGVSNTNAYTGDLAGAMEGADVVIGVSGPNLITETMIRSMAKDAIVFAMANPVPEVMPEVAKKAGARVIATGRSDYPNQINNVLVFPGIFRAVIDGRLKTITTQMKQAAATALASLVPHPTPDCIIPDPFYPDLAKTLSRAILKTVTAGEKEEKKK
jgi:malate dehydrogenase (oxaloacetate-decarboxylating)